MIMTKIFIVDDHVIVRQGLKIFLNKIKDFSIVGEASSGEEALETIGKCRPNVILMDIKMGGMGGIETTKKIKDAFPEVSVLALTAYNDSIFATNFLKAGGLGYVDKQINEDELAKAIRTVSTKKNYLSPSIASRLAIENITNKNKAAFHRLSEREMVVALKVASGKTVPEISQIMGLSPKTVNTYRYRIFNKLAIRSDVELARLMIAQGLIEEAKNS